jgi:glycosyltransferase involved in cell wall biosynthesis
VRVLYVNQTAQVSGAERSLLDILDNLGDAVDPFVACPAGQLADEILARGIQWFPIRGTSASFRLHPLHTTRGLLDIGRSALQVRGLAAALEVDLIHANTTRAALLAILARRRRPPIVSHIRDWIPGGRLSPRVLELVGRRSDVVVAVSAFVERQFDGLRTRRPVRVVHDPVDLAEFEPDNFDPGEARRLLDLPAAPVTLTVLAQITPWKGQDDAIRALASLVAAGHDVLLLLVGSAKFSGAGTQFDNAGFERDLRSLAVELGVDERVRFLGERGDVQQVLATTDILMLPSWREAFGRTAIEGMAMGVPVVATAVGGPAEIVRDGIDGLVLAPRDPERWARELGPLVEDSDRRRAMGAAGRVRAGDFEVGAHVAELMRVYDEALTAVGATAAGS